ncbi:MAG: P1 family peptidase [Pseudomonadota bacterium]
MNTVIHSLDRWLNAPRSITAFLLIAASCVLGTASLLAAEDASDKPRARDLGIPFDGQTGPLNAITDVAGVRVGHQTLIEGEGAWVAGQGPVRTGVTAIFPFGDDPSAVAYAAYHALNGNGEMTGTIWMDESGTLSGPIMITNTHSVGVVRDAVTEWSLMKSGGQLAWSLPVVAETWDGPWPPYGGLNDINGFHVKKEHVFAALDAASDGPVAEGNVGGGTGMICNEFKGGIGTASRRFTAGTDQYTLGVLVQCNYGRRDWLRVAGIPVGREIGARICYEGEVPPGRIEPQCDAEDLSSDRPELGSIIVVVATDAPLLPHQLKRVAQRVTLGLGRLGSAASDSSGDIFVAFSTANKVAFDEEPALVETLANPYLTPVFVATVEATEEAVVNAIIAAETMTGADGYRVPRLPHDDLMQVLRRHSIAE